MKFDLDTYREILDTLTRNKARSLLTGFGVFWGIFMLMVLLGGGQGMKEKLSNNFEGFATNSGIIWENVTSKPYKGFRKGRSWCMDYSDVGRLKEQMPELDVVTPMISHWGAMAVYGDKKSSCNVKGLEPIYTKVEAPKLYYGRYLNDMDMNQHRKVCVLGNKVYKTLFPKGENPGGPRIRIDSTSYDVVGVDYNGGNMNINGSADEAIAIPLTLMQQAYNMGDSVQMICVTARPGYKISALSPKMRAVIARGHFIEPTDEKAIPILNTEVMFSMMDNLFQGVNFLILMVGIGTLLAGAIGVSNIMMVTVRERTTEIGIRRAIGATPKMILSQIVTESVVLTAVAGMSGILFGILILQMIQMGNTTDGIVDAHYQVKFWTAIGALVLLMVLGILAGLAPAIRAMRIKPVDAMRDE